MMDKGVKQRLLGGVVLIAGAALFLPLLFDGSGAGVPLRPEIPAKPAVPNPDDLAPKLDKQAVAANAAVDAAHAEPTFYPVAPAAASAENSVSTGADEQFKMTTPAQPAQPAQAQTDQATQAAVAAAQAKADKAKADQEKAAAAKAQQEQAQQEQAQQQARQAEADRAQAEKDRQARDAKAEADHERAVIEKKLAAEKAAAQKDAREDPGISEAWVVQVASLGSEAKASELVAKLHKKGYRATSHEANGAWKVTVGPELNKDKADSIKQKLAEDSALHLSGWVLPYRP